MVETKRGRGRPRGPSSQSTAKKALLYETALRLFAERGYEQTTLRGIARDAGVSVGLLYRYFPSKLAVVLGLYESLTNAYISQSESMPVGNWRDRVRFSIELSFEVLGPHREILTVLVPTIV